VAVLVGLSLSFGPVEEAGRLPEAAAQPGRTVSVTPAAAKAGELVTVRWTGFTPGSAVSIFQCRTDPLESWTSSCAEPTWTAGLTGPDGSGSAQFVVWQFTFQGLGSNPQLICGESGCGVVVTECDTELSPGQFASASLGVLPGGTNPVDGGDDEEFEVVGAADPAPPPVEDPPVAAAQTASRTVNVQAGQAMDPVLPELAEALLGEGISFDSTVLNSPSALDSYVSGRTDIALSSRPLSAAQQQELLEKGRPSVMVPVAISPQAVIHNMDVRGVPIQRFRLSVDSAAKLYRGLIVGVDSADLRRDNAGCGITQSGRTTDRSVQGLFRTDRSSANYTFSKWLNLAGQDEAGVALWPPIQEGGKPAESPAELFPSAATGQSRINNKELAEFIRVGSVPGASPQITNDQGRLRIGFVDMSAVVELIKETPPAAKPGLAPIRFVEIRNAAGRWVIPTPAAVSATIAGSKIGPDNVVDVNVAATDPKAYPLVSVVYAVVPSGISPGNDAAKAAAGKDVVQFLLSDEGQTILERAGFVRLSGDLKNRANAAASRLVTSSAAPTAPTTVPLGPGSDVLDSSGFSNDFSTGFDSFGGDELFPDGSGDFGDAGVADGGGVAAPSSEEAAATSTIETSQSLLERAAGAPALLAVLVIGLVAAVAGQVLRRVDRRKKAAAAT
jgi:ABC-type phosphate transport system substrate-binding protein